MKHKLEIYTDYPSARKPSLIDETMLIGGVNYNIDASDEQTTVGIIASAQITFRFYYGSYEPLLMLNEKYKYKVQREDSNEWLDIGFFKIRDVSISTDSNIAEVTAYDFLYDWEDTEAVFPTGIGNPVVQWFSRNLPIEIPTQQYEGLTSFIPNRASIVDEEDENTITITKRTLIGQLATLCHTFVCILPINDSPVPSRPYCLYSRAANERSDLSFDSSDFSVLDTSAIHTTPITKVVFYDEYAGATFESGDSDGNVFYLNQRVDTTDNLSYINSIYDLVTSDNTYSVGRVEFIDYPVGLLEDLGKIITVNGVDLCISSISWSGNGNVVVESKGKVRYDMVESPYKDKVVSWNDVQGKPLTFTPSISVGKQDNSSGTQSISTTITKINLGTDTKGSYDTNFFTLSSGVVTCKKKGRVMFSCGAYIMHGSTAGYNGLYVFKNGTEESGNLTYSAASTAAYNPSFVGIIDVEAGDNLDMRGRANVSSTFYLKNKATYFNVIYLQYE